MQKLAIALAIMFALSAAAHIIIGIFEPSPPTRNAILFYAGIIAGYIYCRMEDA